MLREGSLASYVGPPTSRGVQAGDRCTVISDEDTYATVRWASGASTGQFDQIPTRFLAGDERVHYSAFADDYDEFGFEAGLPTHRRLSVASAAVHATGGHTALFRALDTVGVFKTTREAAVAAVLSVLDALESNPDWTEVRSDLADSAQDFTAHVMTSVFQAALTEIRRTHGQEAAPH